MVIIAYEGKSDGEFFDGLLDEYRLDKSKVTYYDFKGKDNLFNISHAYYDELEEDSKIKGCFQYELTDKWVYNAFYKHNKYPFNFQHPNFTNLKQKLKNLFEGTE
ncbi:MAG: hypothetical protein U9O64_01185 [Campylobacterota bacterium]|nr:hypothetical protein [Campylobacterota bacterium]